MTWHKYLDRLAMTLGAGCLIGRWKRRDAERRQYRQAQPPAYQGQPSYRARQAGWNR